MDIGPVFSIDIALRETRRGGTSAAIPTTSQSIRTYRRRIVADRIYSRQVLGIKDWVAQSVIEGVALGLPAPQSSTARPNYLREMRVHRVGWIIVFLFRHPAKSPHRLSACSSTCTNTTHQASTTCCPLCAAELLVPPAAARFWPYPSCPPWYHLHCSAQALADFAALASHVIGGALRGLRAALCAARMSEMAP